MSLIAPELSLLCFALLVVLLDLFVKQKKVIAGVALVGVIVSAGFALNMWGAPTVGIFYNMLSVDNFAILFKFLFLAAAGLVILASQDYVSKFSRFQGEFYALVMLSALGMMLMAAAADFIALYVALELSSISLYVLASFLKDKKSTEAGLKYLLLGAVASAVLLYGMALVFGLTGHTCLVCIGDAIKAMPISNVMDSPALVLGIILLVVGFGFKIASVPFQMWVPDVYEGAPTPVTAYLSVASKAAGFAIILRVFFTVFGAPEWLSQNWGLLIAILSAVTMTVGNVVAIVQTNIKRMLGYSSIAQAGYLMVGLATVGMAAGADALGRSGLLFFLMSYTVTNLGAFIAVIAMSNKINSDMINDFTGMGKRAPLLAIALTLCLVSLTGLPPTAGLIAKIYIFSGAVDHGLLWLVIIAVINSCISAYYYFRVVKVMWLGEPASDEKVPSTWALRTALAICCLAVLVMGVVPAAFVRIAEAAVKILGS
ncbi:MAG: NADH-quinone oxidoreductase subunit N [Chloroflexi bacterium]|nr:NADH-quinone oxidoreductase subunit N [Chloroflexota bacterium]MBM3154461.1 NADH-quinone oxidoreductase subunit N [Chloroflexota bacterium]MBM3172244.1 NADH-quinone oxidoreductase subunit N [Chloroflexota bacterium]MBM3174656.1 NADH-quinone oxidoreductase subunit N [Chloroflexota bacterium]MBM4450023.1 NADH-quinone oxidoreductase subunit N [Chloroflexota bacterium]